MPPACLPGARRGQGAPAGAGWEHQVKDCETGTGVGGTESSGPHSPRGVSSWVEPLCPIQLPGMGQLHPPSGPKKGSFLTNKRGTPLAPHTPETERTPPSTHHNPTQCPPQPGPHVLGTALCRVPKGPCWAWGSFPSQSLPTLPLAGPVPVSPLWHNIKPHLTGHRGSHTLLSGWRSEG